MNKNIDSEILRLAHTDPSVKAALDVHRVSGLSYDRTLEALVVVLARQNADLQQRLIRATEMSVMPRQFLIAENGKVTELNGADE